jgi:hypothetical protein
LNELKSFIFCMTKFIRAGLIATTLFAAISFASASGLTEAQIQAIIGLLNSFGADATTVANVNANLHGQSTTGTNTGISQTPLTWGKATIYIPSDWTVSIIQNDADGYVAQLIKNGGLIATIKKSAAPAPSDSDSTQYDLTSSTFRTTQGLSGSTYLGTCKSQYCPSIPAREVIYVFAVPGETQTYSIKMLVAAAGGYYDTWYQAETAMNPIVVNMTTGSGSSTSDSSGCSFTHDFSYGATDSTTGGEVSKLQQFLINEGVYPEAAVTGYFGASTSRALQTWQVKHGISLTTSGIGVFGPKTRAAMGCSSTSIPGPVITTFYASPSLISTGSASTLYWAVNNTGQCGISAISGDTDGVDLTKATSDYGNGYTSVSTGPLSMSAVYELRCAPLTGSTANYAIKDIAVSVPQSTSAAPTCSTSVTTSRGTDVSSNNGSSNVYQRVMVWNDEPLTIKWSSTNATQAFDYTGNTMATNGSVVIQPQSQSRSLQFQFNNSAGITNCTVQIYPVRASIDQNTLQTSSPTPTISGSATGVSTIEVVVRKDAFSTTRLYDQFVPVVNGRWSATITPAIWGGVYNIDLYGPTDMKLNYIVSGSLASYISTGVSSTPTCTASASPSYAYVNQLFTLSWTSSGIANVQPTNAVGPTIQVASHNGTGESTEELAGRTNPALGGFLNATFGNATELIIGLFALNAGLVEVVKASITGSIIGNLLLVLGHGNLFWRVKEGEANL